MAPYGVVITKELLTKILFLVLDLNLEFMSSFFFWLQNGRQKNKKTQQKQTTSPWGKTLLPDQPSVAPPLHLVQSESSCVAPFVILPAWP